MGQLESGRPIETVRERFGLRKKGSGTLITESAERRIKFDVKF